MTPKRRRADSDDGSEVEGEEEDEVSVDGGLEGSARRTPGSNKRVRVSANSNDLDPRQNEADEEDDEQQASGASAEREEEEEENMYDATPAPDNRPLLPDSFRRSPKQKQRTLNGSGGRLANGLSSDFPPQDAAQQKHQPGSIVRVTLINFVTYTNAEFMPGPNLNMIIGPNGTGKSTLVCAICIGLGYKPDNLGRAKSVSEFVKHGAKRSQIEIELAADPARHEENPVITTRITREGNSTEFLINGKKAKKAEVAALVRSFSIQIDNLCQFLPQDRVVEFARLSPVDLLTQTQLAAAPEHMTQWHEQLKSMRKDQKTKQAEQQSATEHLKSMESRQRLQEGDVQRLRERSELQERVAALEKYRPFPAYKIAKQQWHDAKKARKTAARDQQRLEQQIEPNLRAENEKKAYLDQVTKVVDQRKRLVERAEVNAKGLGEKFEGMLDKLNGCTAEIQGVKNNMRKVREEEPRLKEQKRRHETALRNPPAEFDAAETNEKLRDYTRRIRSIEGQMSELQHQRSDLKGQGEQRQRIIEQAEARKENLNSQEGQLANKLFKVSRDSAKVWEWIQANRDRFTGEVFGPPLIECSVKDQRHANAVESMLQQGDLCAFTVTNQADFNMLSKQCYSALKLSDVNIRSSTVPLAQWRAPCSVDQLRQYGLEDWLLNLIEGPDAVLAMLCDNKFIHQTGYSSRDVSSDQYAALSAANSPCSSWVTASSTYQINRRREYGDKATSTRVNPIRQARCFTDTPAVDRQAEADLDAQIREAEGEFEEIKQQFDELKTKSGELNAERSGLVEEKKELETEKAKRQRAVAEFAGLPVKLDAINNKLAGVEEKLREHKQEIITIVDQGDKLCLEKGQLALDHANAVEALRALHVSFIEAQILAIEAKSDFEHLQARTVEEKAMLDQCKRDVAARTREEKEALDAGKRLEVQCRAVGEPEQDVEVAVFAEVENMAPDQLETEIQSVQARLEMTSGGNENIIREFEQRERKIAQKKAQLETLETELQELFTKITDIRSRWEPELDALIAQISEAFAENFARIQCAGEVAVWKDEEFELWAVQIKVKFRENEHLSILDSHRQSGGERAVSTIFYLMALQSLARAPFRVVDEINQGMDPRNERYVSYHQHFEMGFANVAGQARSLTHGRYRLRGAYEPILPDNAEVAERTEVPP